MAGWSTVIGPAGAILALLTLMGLFLASFAPPEAINHLLFASPETVVQSSSSQYS
jgi:hypothetical protein